MPKRDARMIAHRIDTAMIRHGFGRAILRGSNRDEAVMPAEPACQTLDPLPYRIDPAVLRDKIESPAALTAFDRLDSMGPNWMFQQQGLNRVYVSANLYVKKNGGVAMQGIGTGLVATPDRAVMEIQHKLMEALGMAEDMIVVVNPGANSRGEYGHDSASGEFSFLRHGPIFF